MTSLHIDDEPTIGTQLGKESRSQCTKRPLEHRYTKRGAQILRGQSKIASTGELDNTCCWSRDMSRTYNLSSNRA